MTEKPLKHKTDNEYAPNELTHKQIEKLKKIAASWGYAPTLRGVIEHLHHVLVVKGFKPTPED